MAKKKPLSTKKLSEYKTLPKTFPKFVELQRKDRPFGTRMRLTESYDDTDAKFHYYVDKGNWSCDAQFINGKLLCIGTCKMTKKLTGLEFKKVNEQAYREKN